MVLRKLTTFAATAFIAVAVSAPVLAVEAGDPVKGEKTYKRCKACHQVGDGAKNKTGPILNGLLCSPAASVEGYNYSDPLQAKAGEGLVWTTENLMAWLENPKEFVDGRSKMTLKLKKEADRANVIAYLAQFNADGGMYADGEVPDGICEQ